jgi:type VI protein secretion system component VasK
MLIHPPKFRGLYFTGQLPHGEGKRHAFLERLFKDKVFPEHALAAPTQDKLLSADRRLRRLQIVSAVVLFTLVSWTGFNLYEVWNQSRSIEQVAQRVDTIWRDESGFEAIQPSLQVLADLNASQMYCCGPTPWSLAFSPNAEVEGFFPRRAVWQTDSAGHGMSQPPAAARFGEAQCLSGRWAPA